MLPRHSSGLLALASLGVVASLCATHPAASPSVVANVRSSPPQQLDLVEHEMPIMAPHLYEAVLRSALEPRGSLLRWYIGRVDEEAGRAIAECVLLPHAAAND